jgi:hypothetical protein
MEIPLGQTGRPLMWTRTNDLVKVQELIDSIHVIGLQQVPVGIYICIFSFNISIINEYNCWLVQIYLAGKWNAWDFVLWSYGVVDRVVWICRLKYTVGTEPSWTTGVKKTIDGWLESRKELLLVVWEPSWWWPPRMSCLSLMNACSGGWPEYCDDHGGPLTARRDVLARIQWLSWLALFLWVRNWFSNDQW